MPRPDEPVELTITITLSAREVELLRVIGEPRQVLNDLVDHATQGVYRPLSWERPWLCKALGYDWIERLEPDPGHVRDGRPIFDRPRRG